MTRLEIAVRLMAGVFGDDTGVFTGANDEEIVAAFAVADKILRMSGGPSDSEATDILKELYRTGETVWKEPTFQNLSDREAFFAAKRAAHAFLAKDKR